MNVLIAGGGRIGSSLASQLLGEKHTVTVVERDSATAESLFQQLGVLCIAGDATDPKILERASIGSIDVVVGALPTDAANLAFVMVARSMSTARLMVRMLDGNFRRAYRLAGVRDIIAEAEVVVGRILTAIEFPLVLDAMPLPRGRALLVEVPISPRAPVEDKTIAEVRADPEFPRDCTFIALVDADGSVTVPDGGTRLRGGQTAILVAPRDKLATVINRLHDQAPGFEPDMLAQLRRIELLAPLTDEELLELLRNTSVVRVDAGETIFRVGDSGDRFYILLKGEVELIDDSGDTVERLGRGGFFGEISLLTGEPRLTTARAANRCELGALPQQAFQRLLMTNPAIALEMTKTLGHRLAASAKANRSKRRRMFGRG